MSLCHEARQTRKHSMTPKILIKSIIFPKAVFCFSNICLLCQRQNKQLLRFPQPLQSQINIMVPAKTSSPLRKSLRWSPLVSKSFKLPAVYREVRKSRARKKWTWRSDETAGDNEEGQRQIHSISLTFIQRTSPRLPSCQAGWLVK